MKTRVCVLVVVGLFTLLGVESRGFTNLSLSSVAGGFSVPASVSSGGGTVVAEYYGPFSSWGNVKTKYGAAGDGTTDDSTAIQAALSAVSTGGYGSTNPPSVIYFPLGTYRVTQTLTLLSRERFNIVADPGTRILWAGASGGTLFHLDGCDSGYFARLAFDGGGTAAVVFDHTKVNGAYFDADNVFEDCAFVNGGTGMRGGAAGQGFASIMFRRCTFANCTVDGASVGNYNALDGYIVDCLLTNCNVGIHIYEGSLHPYRSLFVGNGTDIQIDQGLPFESIVSNQSFNAGQFIYGRNIGQNGGAVLIKDNLVVDSSGSKPVVEMGVMGPLMFMDNTFANSATTNAVRLFNPSGVDVLAIGNQYTMPNLVGIEVPVPSTARANMVDNTLASRSSLNLTRMTLPAAATNLNRHTVEVSATAGDSQIQAAIYSVTNWAGQGPVVDIPVGSHTITQTVVVPGGLDVTLVGDGWNDEMQWGVGTGVGPMFRLQAPARAGLQQFSATEYAKGDGIIFVEGANVAGSRVLMQDCSVSQAASQNIWMDDCPNLVVEMDGDGHGNTQVSGSTGVSIEQTGRGKFQLFCADSGSNWRTYRSETNGEMYIETSWYEDHSPDVNFASIAGAGTVTFLSGKMASGGSGADLTMNSFQVKNWNGQFTLALMGMTDALKITGSGSGSVWLTGGTGNQLTNWFNNASSGLTFEATQNGNYASGANQIPDVGTASAAFTRQMLAKARTEFMIGPVIPASPTGATDVRLIRINPMQGIRDIAIYSGTAP